MLKRLNSEEVVVGDLRLRIRPLGAMNATHVFGDMVSVVLPVIGTVGLSTNIESIQKLDADTIQSLVDGLDADSLVNALAKIDGSALTKIISELVIDYKNTSFLNDETGNWCNMTLEDFDELFCMNMAGIMKLCGSVIKQNFGSFFADVGGLFGDALKKAAEKKTSHATETLTESK